MTRVVLFIISAFISSHSLAEMAPLSVIAGANVNTWTQFMSHVSDKPFDFAVNGNGFFVLQLPSGTQAYSRYGEMSLNADGFLIHSSSRGKVMGYCDRKLKPINFNVFARDVNNSVIKAFRTDSRGTILVHYENGTTTETCSIALALFQNPTKLSRHQHILQSTFESGKAYIGFPQEEGRGSIIESALEELNEQTYRFNVKPVNIDRISDEIEKERMANDYWLKQKTLFYVYDLNVTRTEFFEIESSAEKYNAIAKKFGALSYQSSDQILSDKYPQQLVQALIQHENEVLNILGQSRFEKAKDFRDSFNRNLWRKFGTLKKYSAF